MGKAVLISIQPQWCELIASGKKTVEVRKTKPNIDTPFPVYIYQTKKTWVYNLYSKIADWQGKVIGEFVCKEIDRIGRRGFDNNFDYCYLSLDVFGNDDIEIEITDIKKSCILKKELNMYGEKANCLYAWHITNLVIYDEPKELSEFHTVDKDAVRSCGHRHQSYCSAQCDSGYIKNGFYCDRTADWCTQCTTKPITRAPQSWCFVEELR